MHSLGSPYQSYGHTFSSLSKYSVKMEHTHFFSCNILFVLMAICYKEMTSIRAKYIVVLRVTHRTDSCGIVWCAICIMVHNSDSTIYIVKQLIMSFDI